MMSKSWTNLEFQAYVLLFAAHSNYLETQEEKNYILLRVSPKTFYKIHNEIINDTDFEKEQKIKAHLQYRKISEEDKNQLMKEIKEVFFADGSVDALEKDVFLYLREILK